LNNFTIKYCSTPPYQTWWKWTKTQDRQIYRTQQENFEKKVVQVWKITNFDRQPALFNGASMGAIT
jgi:hypothetical protein